jgi:PII-like signaling protein
MRIVTVVEIGEVDSRSRGGQPVKLPREAKLLRIFVGESDKHEGRPLYEAIVEAARARHLAGATVLRGPLGYGASSRIHTAKILRLSEDLPMVIEIVDVEEKINAFLPELDAMIDEGLVTLEKVEVLFYRHQQET